MLAIVGCDCHNGITLSQKVLREGGIENWLSVPTYQGRKAAHEFLAQVGDVQELDGTESLAHFVDNHGTYSIIVGYDGQVGGWVNVGSGKMAPTVRAQALAKYFA